MKQLSENVGGWGGDWLITSWNKTEMNTIINKPNLFLSILPKNVNNLLSCIIEKDFFIYFNCIS